ncbi:hypothetical protein [Nannocystis pusilla]|uniref:Uncharacterized protein n=1 Tax=Nannocystis pusilla TaxID=889268 RepID=A0ABS7TJQ1_9BACT|nr:hypothetical protein [Nannocystis pusilla]MBZ5708439.1 hypothetical protein [Nannocystis pusilla]
MKGTLGDNHGVGEAARITDATAMQRRHVTHDDSIWRGRRSAWTSIRLTGEPLLTLMRAGW